MAPRIPIFNMFGPSPLGPLEKHIDKASACANALLDFFEVAIAGDWEKAEEEFHRICALEEEADDLKQDLRLHLHKDLFLPVPRSDLLGMLMLQDRIANKAKDIAGLVIGRQMQLPEEIKGAFLLLLQRSLDAVTKARKAINELDELLEAGFRGNEVTLVKGMLEELDLIERDTDRQQHQLRLILFKMEKDIPPIDCICLYKLIEWTGALADRAEAVGGQLQIILAS